MPPIFMQGGLIKMATPRIISMHINRGKTIAQCLTDRTDYAKNDHRLCSRIDDTVVLVSKPLVPALILCSFVYGKQYSIQLNCSMI